MFRERIKYDRKEDVQWVPLDLVWFWEGVWKIRSNVGSSPLSLLIFSISSLLSFPPIWAPLWLCRWIIHWRCPLPKFGEDACGQKRGCAPSPIRFDWVWRESLKNEEQHQIIPTLSFDLLYLLSPLPPRYLSTTSVVSVDNPPTLPFSGVWRGSVWMVWGSCVCSFIGFRKRDLWPYGLNLIEEKVPSTVA